MSPATSHFAMLAPAIAFAALLSTPAQAVQTYCVGTPAEFQAALDDAEADGEDSRIDVRSGTYALGSDLQYIASLGSVMPPGKLTIEGGYGPGCVSQTDNASLTTLQANGNRRLYLSQTWDSVTIKTLSFDGASLVLVDALGDTCASADQKIELRRLRVDGGHLALQTSCHDITLRDSLLVNGHNDSVGGNADQSLFVFLINYEDLPQAPSLNVINSSVINGRTTLQTGGDEQGIAFLYNSLFVRSGTDIFTEGTSVYARNNRYDGISFQPHDNLGDEIPAGVLLPGSGNNLSVAPDLDANYRPNPGSPMLDSGTATVPGGLASIDIYGADRVIGAQVDRGAIEAPITGSGVYTVTNTNSSGSGSLTDALTLANSDSGYNLIHFNIPGACPRRIDVPTTLTVRDHVLIDGSTQPGSVANTLESGWNAMPCVILDGNGSTGTGFLTGTELNSGGSLNLRGLAFEGFNTAILLTFGSINSVRGSQFGGQIGASGPLLTGNGNAITVAGANTLAIIGGSDPQQANLIGDSSEAGILVTGNSGGNLIVGNRIGIGKTFSSALPNQDGVRLYTSGNRISGNTISRNSQDGILLSSANAHDNTIDDNDLGGISGNLISTPGNGRMGVMIDNDAHDNTIESNYINTNGDSGVRVMTAAGGRNAILANRIAANGAPGIDLRANDVTPNDPDGVEACHVENGCAGNGGQNFPALETAYRVAGTESVYAVISGSLTTQVNSSAYRIDFYRSTNCDDSGHGQGAHWIGSKNVTVEQQAICQIANNCRADFSFARLDAGIEVGDAISATATSPGGSTSEFTACVLVEEGSLGNDTIFVDSFDGD